MQNTMSSVGTMLAIAVSASAETHTVLVDLEGFTPDTLEVAPGDTIVFNVGCMTIVATGLPCEADGMFSGVSYPLECPDIVWEVPQLPSLDVPIFARTVDQECDPARTANITIVNGDTHDVPDDFATIGAAIDAASSGDRINIAAGTYYEHDLMIDMKVIALQGEAHADGTPGVIIDAQQQSRVLSCIGGGPAPGEPGLSIIDNIVFTGGYVDGDGGGVSVTNSSPVFRNCVFTQNTCAGNGGGVHALLDAQDASWIQANPTFSRVRIFANSALDGGGMHVEGGGEATLTNCLVTENSASDGIGGMHHVGGGDSTIDYTIVCGNVPVQIFGNISVGYACCTLSNCVDSDGDGVIDNCEAGDADGILYVPSEYPTLQLAQNEATDGDTIAISAGTYSGSLSIEGMSVSVIGETNPDGTPAVTLTGNITMNSGGASQIRIEHLNFRMLTLLECDASVLNCNIYNSSGQWAGVAISNATGTFEDCAIVDHHGTFFTGGMMVLDFPDLSVPYSNLTFINCVFKENTGEGPFGSQGSSGVNIGSIDSVGSPVVDFIGCVVTNNNAGFGGMRFDSSSTVSLTDTVVCDNSTVGEIAGAWTDGGGNCVQESCDDCNDCPADLDGNGEISVDDLLALLAAFQINDDGDCDDDGDTDVNDLLVLIAAWGDCP